MKNGWKMVRLGEVLKPSENQVSVMPLGNYPQIGIRLWGEGAYAREDVLGSETQYRLFYKAEKGDLTFNKIWVRNGAVTIIQEDLDGYFVSPEFPVYHPKSDVISPDWLFFLTKCKFFWDSCNEKAFGTSGKNRVKPSEFLAVEIPLPPLTEQQRIAGRLSALKEKIDAVRGLRGEQVREVERVEENFSKAIFEKALIEHQTVRLSEIAHLITKGSSPNWQGINYVENEGVLFITSENVRQYKIRLEPKKFVEARFNEIEKKSILRRNDILMNIVGASIGRTAIYDRDDVANINQAVCLIRLDKTKIDLEYALHFFNSPVCVSYMFDKQVDAARANLSMGNISNFLIPLPDLTEQRHIVAEIQTFQTKMERLKAAQAGQLAGLEGLFPGVLEQAFRGEW